MKKLGFAVLAVVVLSIGGGNAFAQTCDDGPDYHCLFLNCWYDYSEAQSCYTTGGNVGEWATCSSDGWSFANGSNSYASVSFTVSDAGSYFEAYSDVFFNDPNNSAGNVIIIDAFVDHPGTFNDDYYPLYSHDGTDGYLGCASVGGVFYASSGDIVTVSINVAKQNSNTTIEATVPRIMSPE